MHRGQQPGHAVQCSDSQLGYPSSAAQCDTRLWITVHSCDSVVEIKSFSNNKLDGWLQMSASQMMRLSLLNSLAPRQQDSWRLVFNTLTKQ